MVKRARYRNRLIHPLLAVVSIAALDALLGESAVLIGFLVLGPLIASVLVGPRETALVTVVATLAGVVLGEIDGILGSGDHALRLGVVVAGGAIATVLARFREEREVVVERLAAEHAVAQVLSETSSRRDATRRLLEALAGALDFDLAAMWTVKDDTMQVVDIWHREGLQAVDFEEACRHAAFHRGVGLPGRVWALDTAVWIDNLEVDANFPRAPLAARAGLRTGLGFPIRGSNGDVIGMVELHSREQIASEPGLLATLDGVGTRIGQYIQRRLAEEALHQSDARTAAVVSSALDCIITMDHEGHVIEFNPAAEDTFGYTREEAIGSELAELIIPPDLRERHRRGLAHFLSTGEGPFLERRVELRAIRKDRSEFPVEVAITPIRLQGPPIFTGYLRDITERKRAELERETLLEMERRARGAAEEAEQHANFLARASSLLDESLDYDTTLRRLAQLAVPHVADLCAVDVIDENGEIHHVGLAHVSPVKLELAKQVRDQFPAAQPDPEGIGRTLRTGEPLLYESVSDDVLRAIARTPEHLEVLRKLAINSAIVVPMVTRGRTLGSILLVASEGGRSYSDEDLRLAEELGRRAAVAVDNARLYSERSYIARTLQESLLPPVPPEIPGVEAAARYHAAGEGFEVGGDFYDLFPSGDGSWSFVIGDVCGKGADAAAVTALARYTLRAGAIQQGSPAHVLRLLNEAMLSQRDDRRFCTVLFGRLALRMDGVSITLASGGHPLPLLLRADGEVRDAGEFGALIGVLDTPQLADRDIELGPGDAIVMYTDGVSDALGANLRKLVAGYEGLDAETIAERLEQAAAGAQSGRPRDDIAILVLRVPPGG